MAQSNYVISNATSGSVRSQINAAFQASATLNSGATEPSTTYAGMIWHDTNTNILKMRTNADDAWINVAYIDQTNELWSMIQGNKVVNTSGTEVGRLDVQSTTAWETGTSTVESLVSPAKIKAALDESTGFSSSQSWSDETSNRAFGTNYTNSTGRMIQVSVSALGGLSTGPGENTRLGFIIFGLVGGVTISKTVGYQLSSTAENTQNLTFNVPNGSTYRVNRSGGPSLEYWFELK